MQPTVVQVIGNTVIGGSEMHLVSLVEGLRSRGTQVPLIVTPGKGPLTRILRQRSIPFHHVDIGTGDHERAVSEAVVTELVELFEGLKPDVVHCHLYPAQAHGTLAAYLAGIPTVTTMHRLEPLRPGSVVLPLRTGSHTIGVCNAVGESLVAHGVPRQLVEVIHNAASPERFQTDPIGAADLRRELAPDGGPLVGTVARLSPEKGVDVLLRAVPTLVREFPNAHVVVAGYGPSVYGLRKLAAEIGVERNVNFLGIRHDVHDLNQAFDVFVLPSHSEACPLALLDAMAAGAVCVATRVGGIPEIVSDGVDGVLVEPGDPEALADALIRVLRQRQRLRGMGEDARGKAMSCFSLNQLVARTQALYGRLADESVRRNRHTLAERRHRLPEILNALEIARTAGGSVYERIRAAESDAEAVTA